MAKKNYVVIRTGTYGKTGNIVELDLGKDGLSDRQSIMLKPYEKPVAKADESKELSEAKATIGELEAQIADIKKQEESTFKQLNDDNFALTGNNNGLTNLVAVLEGKVKDLTDANTLLIKPTKNDK
tara:strand:- start:125 stop:502 length:378 start_codon:yes stop_codon:yes gene_type:complete